MSKKVFYVKALEQDNVTFIKGMVKKSFGQISRPAILKFVHGIPSKGHCTCPVGLSGICCHILCALHFLIHLTETGEKVVALTATQQLQRWHKKGQQGKGSIPMLPVRQLVKVPSARLIKVKNSKKLTDAFKTGTPDLEKPGLKRNVEGQMVKYDKKFKAIGYSNIEKHFNNILQLDDIGRKSSPGMHLKYKYADTSRQALALDHDYCQPGTVENAHLTGNRESAHSSVALGINSKLPKLNFLADPTMNTSPDIKTLIDFVNPNDCKDIEAQIKSQWKEVSDISAPKEIFLNLRNKSAIKPQATKYHIVSQNTEAWQEIRKGVLTASKLPYLLGLYGEAKFNSYWFCVRNKVSEKSMFPTQFRNFERGHKFEGAALKHLESVTGCTTSTCGYFSHPSDSNYGASHASPDAVFPGPILLEIKQELRIPHHH